METLLNRETLTRLSDRVLDWTMSELLLVSTLVQLAVLIISLGGAYLTVKRLRPALSAAVSTPRFNDLVTVRLLLRDIVLPTFFLAYQSVGALLLRSLEMPSSLVTISWNLTLAWIAIRIFSIFVRNEALSRLLAFCAWTIAALNIVGWLDPTIAFLDSFALSVGDMRVSLLTFVQGMVTMGFLLWFAVVLSDLTERRLRKVSSFTPSLQVLFGKLTRIALIIFAILIGIASIGIDITALAVFSGALGVGLGFGLQRIFANFIAGIVLLLDRSIKPGDVIEVEDTYGWINKLSGRHVSVITRDGKEHLIPNEDLITQKVVNWSYSSNAVRIKTPIRVSFQSDVVKARDLILEAAGEVKRILTNPPTVCLMTGFDDNSVNFELRCWIDDPSNGVANIKSEIYFKLWDKFHTHGIAIPYPQRDVHLDISEDTQDKLHALFNRDGKP